jgi:hypothetical protein
MRGPRQPLGSGLVQSASGGGWCWAWCCWRGRWANCRWYRVCGADRPGPRLRSVPCQEMAARPRVRAWAAIGLPGGVVTRVVRTGRRETQELDGSGRSRGRRAHDGHGCPGAGIRRPRSGRQVTVGLTFRHARGSRCGLCRTGGCRSQGRSQDAAWCRSSCPARESHRYGPRTSPCIPLCTRGTECGPVNRWAHYSPAGTVRTPVCTGGCCEGSAISTRSPSCLTHFSAALRGCCRSMRCRYPKAAARRPERRRRWGRTSRIERLGRRGRPHSHCPCSPSLPRRGWPEPTDQPTD